MNKTILVVDIETTSFLNQGGKIVEIGIVKLDLVTGKITPVYSSLINEPGFDINHTKEPFGWIFKNSDLTFDEIKFAPSLESQREIIQGLFNEFEATAYNKEFDFGFLIDRGFKINELSCPMLLSTPIVNLPANSGFKQPKWPKVEEVWKLFFGKTGYVEAHRGLDDAKHEAKIVYELFKRGKFKVSENDQTKYVENVKDINKYQVSNFKQKVRADKAKPTLKVTYNGYKWIFFDQLNREINDIKYIPKGNVSNGLILVKNKDKYGYLNQHGELIIPAIYETAYSFSEGLACVKYKGKYGFINEKGSEIIPYIYQDALIFYDGLASVGLNHKHGYIDKQGNIVIPLKYDYANIFKNELAAVALFSKGYGMINKKGEEVIPLMYDNAFYFSVHVVKIKMNGKWAIFDCNGNQLTRFKYNYINDLKFGKAVVGVDKKIGFINHLGKEIIPVIYENLSSVDEGWAYVELDGRWLKVNDLGEEIFD